MRNKASLIKKKPNAMLTATRSQSGFLIKMMIAKLIELGPEISGKVKEAIMETTGEKPNKDNRA